MLESLKKFLEKLQNANENQKTRWLIIGTAAITVLVLFVWLKYFNSLIAFSEKKQNPQSPAASFWETFKNGASVIYGQAKEQIQNTQNKIKSSTDYDIKPENRK